MSSDDVPAAIQQLYPGLSVGECTGWLNWVEHQPDYYIARVGKAVCITKVYNQIDPPWLRVAHEVAWWGTGRDAVRALHRGMAWARLKGATHYGYSLVPHLDIVKWRVL
jgi:hypothetical protein